LVNLPFEEKGLGENIFLRLFDPQLETNELKWHIDLEDRIIQVVENTDWKFQFDNQLPISFSGEIFVPAGVWHRLIKGNGQLKIKVTKLLPYKDI
jgi:hypothetical protein